MIHGGRAGENDLSDLKEVVDKAVIDIRALRKQFDAIAVRGNSGLLVGAPVALRVKLPLIIIRKPRAEISHHGFGDVVGVVAKDSRVLHLDDFRSTGSTERAVAAAVMSAGAVVTMNYYYREQKIEGSFWYRTPIGPWTPVIP